METTTTNPVTYTFDIPEEDWTRVVHVNAPRARYPSRRPSRRNRRPVRTALQIVMDHFGKLYGDWADAHGIDVVLAFGATLPTYEIEVDDQGDVYEALTDWPLEIDFPSEAAAMHFIMAFGDTLPLRGAA